jgi:hypothetical protein
MSDTGAWLRAAGIGAIVISCVLLCQASWCLRPWAQGSSAQAQICAGSSTWLRASTTVDLSRVRVFRSRPPRRSRLRSGSSAAGASASIESSSFYQARALALINGYKEFEGRIPAARQNVIFTAMQWRGVFREMAADCLAVHDCSKGAPNV